MTVAKSMALRAYVKPIRSVFPDPRPRLKTRGKETRLPKLHFGSTVTTKPSSRKWETLCSTPSVSKTFQPLPCGLISITVIEALVVVGKPYASLEPPAASVLFGRTTVRIRAPSIRFPNVFFVHARQSLHGLHPAMILRAILALFPPAICILVVVLAYRKTRDR
jgi:hypothetical protein